jgi:hypothetical protein
MAALFTLGEIVITQRAAILMQNVRMNPASLFLRHVVGDWGDVSADQRRTNEEAVREGGRILSAYGRGNLRLYVITEADRSTTTIRTANEDP